jgi:type II secretory pathway component PulJ
MKNPMIRTAHKIYGRVGMTLIEVMLAVVILGAGMSVLLTGASRCLAVMRQSKEYQQAQWVMSVGQLEHPFMFAEDIEEQAVSGEDYDGYTFIRDIEEDDDEDELFVVRTRVVWERNGRERMTEIVEYVFQVDEDEE